ncbi:red chlorophyll catabolite reductase-like [Tasmannia lanceolata]|uniref:red chlorophyll catabolite reductase-like n=1 Tax=Tasmannia lanceolata TaxID=3420 RepID=UPI004062CCC5
MSLTSCNSCMTSSYDLQKWSSKLIEFPHVSTSHRNLMLDILSSIDTHLGPQLLPSSIPPDLAYFENDSTTSQGALDIRLGQKDSTIDFMVGYWTHCEFPSESAFLNFFSDCESPFESEFPSDSVSLPSESVYLNMTTLFAILKPTTDAPHLIVEFIQYHPNSLILIMDLIPRKDLVLHPEYLQIFYEDTLLEKHRQKLEKLPESQPFLSASLYNRSHMSPTAILVRIDCDGDMKEMLRDHVGVVVKDVLRIWLENCVGRREIGEIEREILVRRDNFLKRYPVYMDIADNLPLLFSPEIARRVTDALLKVFRKCVTPGATDDGIAEEHQRQMDRPKRVRRSERLQKQGKRAI